MQRRKKIKDYMQAKMLIRIALVLIATFHPMAAGKMSIESKNSFIRAMTSELFEPAYLPKGPEHIIVKIRNKANLCYDNYLEVDEIQSESISVLSNNHKIISITDVDPMPQLGFLKELPRDELFSIFMPNHQRLASKLIALLMAPTTDDAMLTRAYCLRDKSNPGLFIYALAIALAHRGDTRSLKMPPLTHIFPGNFIKSSELEAASQRMLVDFIKKKDETVIDMPFDFSGTDLDPEHWLSYFREDVFINLHHWHWHIRFPFMDDNNPDNIDIVDKDRRGELFYYMHQQVIARYNFERLSNRLPLVEPFNDLKIPIAEGYYSKLNQAYGSKPWAGRSRNMLFQALNRGKFKLNIEDLTRWKNRIIDSIIQGRVRSANNTGILLSADKGIDILGNMVESSMLSINKNFYGNLHNMMHVFTALVHDPDGRYKEDMGVMGETSTAMRDPVFYRVHSMVDNLFNMFKETLPPYTKNELDFPNIEVTDIHVMTDHFVNEIKTHWEKFTISLNTSLDFLGNQHTVSIKTERLQHTPFRYRIWVKNNGQREVKGFVRIFMAPKYNDREQELEFAQQRRLFIELDRFPATIPPNNATLIERTSKDSTVGVEYPNVLTDAEENSQCGWPLHMLIPKGMPGGYAAQLFVIVTDYEVDMVHPQGTPRPEKDVPPYCGLKDNKQYPDKRAMGFPFDRSNKDVQNLTNFVSLTKNMAFTDVTINHINVVKDSELSTPGVNYGPSGHLKSSANDVLPNFVLDGSKFYFSFMNPNNFSPAQASWHTARKYCTSMGLDLVTIPSSEHFAALIKIARESILTANIDMYNVWTGAQWKSGLQLEQTKAYGRIRSDKYRWISNDEEMRYNFIVKSILPGPCVNFLVSRDDFSFWSQNCSRSDFHFICSEANWGFSTNPISTITATKFESTQPPSSWDDDSLEMY